MKGGVFFESFIRLTFSPNEGSTCAVVPSPGVAHDLKLFFQVESVYLKQMEDGKYFSSSYSGNSVCAIPTLRRFSDEKLEE